MDQTLHALGVLFLKALPTFILVLLLHFYLKRMFFGPLQRALKAREEGKSPTILFNLSGHGLLDLSAYETHQLGKIQDV